MTPVPAWAWAATFAVLAALIAADLVLTRGADRGLRSAAAESALWLAAALAFGGVLWLWRSPSAGGQYLAGYLLERALSVDNIFVFVLLFTSLAVPAELQRRILLGGVIGALVLRGAFIAAGGALIEHLSWIFYVFGALVLLAGVRMFRAGQGGSGNNLAVRGLRRVLPVSDHYAGSRFFTRTGGRAGDLGVLLVLHRPAGRPGVRGQAVGRAAAGAGRLGGDQRADRGRPPDQVAPVTGARRRTG